MLFRSRFARRRFGRYEVIDFVAVLFGYAISGERTLEAFYEHLHPYAAVFMALFGRERLPARSTLSHTPYATVGRGCEAGQLVEESEGAIYAKQLEISHRNLLGRGAGGIHCRCARSTNLYRIRSDLRRGAGFGARGASMVAGANPPHEARSSTTAARRLNYLVLPAKEPGAVYRASHAPYRWDHALHQTASYVVHTHHDKGAAPVAYCGFF